MDIKPSRQVGNHSRHADSLEISEGYLEGVYCQHFSLFFVVSHITHVFPEAERNICLAEVGGTSHYLYRKKS